MKGENSYLDVSVDVFSICLSALYVFFATSQSSLGSLNFQVWGLRSDQLILFISLCLSTERVLRRLAPFTSHNALYSWSGTMHAVISPRGTATRNGRRSADLPVVPEQPDPFLVWKTSKHSQTTLRRTRGRAPVRLFTEIINLPGPFPPGLAVSRLAVFIPRL